MRILLFVFLISCGSNDGPPGESGLPGKDAAPCTVSQDKDGATIVCPNSSAKVSNGERGRDGKDAKAPPSVDPSLLGSRGFCSARFDYDDSGYWYKLRLWIYNFKSGERYLFGRSDRVEGNRVFPDSASFFGNQLFTSEFRFFRDKDKRWKYEYGRYIGSFDCGN